MNRSLAMKHAYFQQCGTSSGCRLRHIIEMPLFVRSELSNGIQLADLVSYNIYRAFKTGDLAYPWFRKVTPFIWPGNSATPGIPTGLKIFPPESPFFAQASSDAASPWLVQKKDRGAVNTAPQRLMSSGANPIEPTCGTGP